VAKSKKTKQKKKPQRLQDTGKKEGSAFVIV
jgi:hypothetical protein